MKELLKNWIKKTLWFRVMNGPIDDKNSKGPLIEFDILYPIDIEKKECIKLMSHYAAQGVKIIRQLHGKNKGDYIIQGAYQKIKDENG